MRWGDDPKDYSGPSDPASLMQALRQAAISSLDLEQIVKGVWLNVGVPSNGPIPPSSWAYDNSIPPEKRDLAKVKAKLARDRKMVI